MLNFLKGNKKFKFRRRGVKAMLFIIQFGEDLTNKLKKVFLIQNI